MLVSGRVPICFFLFFLLEQFRLIFRCKLTHSLGKDFSGSVNNVFNRKIPMGKYNDLPPAEFQSAFLKEVSLAEGNSKFLPDDKLLL